MNAIPFTFPMVDRELTEEDVDQRRILWFAGEGSLAIGVPKEQEPPLYHKPVNVVFHQRLKSLRRLTARNGFWMRKKVARMNADGKKNPTCSAYDAGGTHTSRKGR